MRRVCVRLASPLVGAAFLAAAYVLPAAAGPADDYLAAKAKAVTAARAAAKAGRNEEAALKDLGRRMSALVGPVRFKGLGAPAFTLEFLVGGEDEPNATLDGLAFADTDDTMRLVVSPEPIFNAWLAARAADARAPAAFAEGLKGAAGTYYFVNNAVINTSGSFDGYADLPLAGAGGETIYASLGFYGDEVPGNNPPNTIAIVRVAEGRAVVGITAVELTVPPMKACDAIWAPFKAKGDALSDAADKDGKEDDPRWEEAAEVYDDGASAYRACFAREAKGKPFLAEAQAKAEAFLKIARGG